MATQKPVEWVSSLIIRFEEQVSFRKIIVVHVNHYLRPVSAVRDSGGPPTLPSPIPVLPPSIIGDLNIHSFNLYRRV